MSTYIVTDPTNQRLEYQSVTAFLKQMDKSEVLITWAVGQALKYITLELSGIDNPSKEIVLEIADRARTEYKRVGNEAMSIGTQVHDVIELHIKAILAGEFYTPPINLPQQVLNSLQAYFAWEKDNVVQYLESESKIIHPKMGYAGTLDCIVILKEAYDKKGKVIREQGVFLIDFKTSADFYPEYALQISSYAEARESMQGEYLFEHEYEIIVDGVKENAFSNSTATYKPLKIDGVGILRLDKITGEPFFKDYSEVRDRAFVSFQLLVMFYYNFKDRRIANSPWTKAMKEKNNLLMQTIRDRGIEIDLLPKPDKKKK